jgi:hypothetical protein
MNEKTTDQKIEDEISDEEVEVAAMKDGAGAWTFVCTMDCNVIEPESSLRVLPYDRSRFKAQPLGDRFKDGRLGGVASEGVPSGSE